MPTITDKIYYNGYPPVPNDFEPYGPYNSVSSALSQIINVLEAECSGLTFGITDGSNNVTEYWLQPSSTAGQYVAVPKSIPRITSSDANKFLKVNANADGMTWDTVTNYYPTRSYTAGLQISTSSGVADTCALYVPYATTNDFGVVKVGSGLSVSSGVVSVDSNIAKTNENNQFSASQNIDGSLSLLDGIISIGNTTDDNVYQISNQYANGIKFYNSYSQDELTINLSNTQFTYTNQAASGSILFPYVGTSAYPKTLATTEDTAPAVDYKSTAGVSLGSLKFVKCTQSEYDNLQNKDSNTFYVIYTSSN